MRRLSRIAPLVIIALALCALPGLALAQAAGAEVPAAAFEWGGVASIFGALVTLLTAFMQWLPSGWHTPVAGAVGIFGELGARAAELPQGTSLIFGIVALGAVVVARFRSKAHVAGVKVLGWEL